MAECWQVKHFNTRRTSSTRSLSIIEAQALLCSWLILDILTTAVNTGPSFCPALYIQLALNTISIIQSKYKVGKEIVAHLTGNDF